jgi:hypothetical protein
VYVGFQLLLCVISTVVSVVATSMLKKFNDKDCLGTNPRNPKQRRNDIEIPWENKRPNQVLKIEGMTERNNGNNTNSGTNNSYNNTNSSNNNATRSKNTLAMSLFHLEQKTNFAMIVFNAISQIVSAVILFSLYWI